MVSTINGYHVSAFADTFFLNSNKYARRMNVCVRLRKNSKKKKKRSTAFPDAKERDATPELRVWTWTI